MLEAATTKVDALGALAAVQQGRLNKGAGYNGNYCCFTGKLQIYVGIPGATKL